MTPPELERALPQGVRISEDAAAEDYDVLLVGEMGIGNTATAAIGRGSGAAEGTQFDFAPY
jgi:NaMN:DMB phosphoribosyltransferase